MSEAEGVSKSFDPRFSRAFQPGYDARVHREEPPAAGLRDEPRSDRSGADRQANEAPTFAVSEPVGSATDSEAGLAAQDSAEDEELYPTAWWHRVNPWFLVLWGLGIAFMVAGIVLITQAIELQDTASQGANQSFAFFVFMQTAAQGAPMLIVLGLATLTSTAVIQAARWRRR